MNYVYKTKPYPHQVRALKKLLRNRGGGAQVPMRWGKTKMAIDFAGAMHLLERVERVLVVTVTDGVPVWHEQIALHCAVPWTVLEPYDGSSIWVSVDGENKHPGSTGVAWKVINFQGLYARESIPGQSWVPVERKELVEFNADLVIVDESHHIGNPETLQAKHAYKLGNRARFRLFMTGTMFHRKPFYVFGQIKFFDDGIFGTNWGHFKDKVAIMGGRSGYEILRYRNLKWMVRKVKRWVYMEEYVPLREPVVNVIPAPLTGRNLQVYKKMEAENIVHVDGSRATADIILTKHLRCQQIAGGWLKTDDGYKRVGTCKLDMAASRLAEYREQDILKAVIGCRFLPELADLIKLARKLGYTPIPFFGSVPKADRPRRIAQFQDTSKPTLFIAQIRAAREAIDLSAASTMMLYSLTESYLDYDQFRRRIEVFEDTRTLQYDHIIVPGTRDEVAWQAMQEKQDVATFIVKRPDLVEAIVARNSERKAKG